MASTDPTSARAAPVLRPQAISLDVLRDKYAKGGETDMGDVQRRVARALAGCESRPEDWEPRFREALAAGFIPAGRILSAAGTDLGATLINCFVQPVGDAISEVDGRGKPGIYVALREAAETMRRGGGVGYDFSVIRPKGALVRGTASRASGPVSYMRVFDRSCETVESAGARRGAQMGVLRCDHPDIEEFVHAKAQAGELTNFNVSVGVTDAFVQAVRDDADWDLLHSAEPGPEQRTAGAKRLDDGRWRYRSLPARALWDAIMRATYEHAEPGVLFLDRMNAENNLHYLERIEATNPCGEQPLPDYGCCCLGSLDLTRFVDAPFQEGAALDLERLAEVAAVAVRMLDDVLDLTYWPLPRQREEAMAKRRVGLGFTGLGDALLMLGLRYGSAAGRERAAQVAAVLRDAAYRASVALAREKGAFPALDAAALLQSGFARRLPEDIREAVAAHGLRNSHLLSVAPTGTISLAFADNASNGIEPPYCWTYTRRKREADGSVREYPVEDRAWRLYKAAGGDVDRLPEHWVTALEMPVRDHLRMLEAVQPYVDTSISKTVNVPVEYPFEDFKGLYLEGWEAGLKGLATFRPNAVTGAVLSGAAPVPAPDFDESDPDRRVRLETIPRPALASLRWRKRPRLPGGNPSWTYMLDHPRGAFAVFVGHTESPEGPHPFEVWVNGQEQPRGLGALAKTLSMDMRSNDRGWLRAKLDSLARAGGGEPFTLTMPGGGRERVPGVVAAFARLVLYRCEELGAFGGEGETPVLDALMSPKEPKTGTDGTLSWTVDVLNPNTGDDFVLGLKELMLPDGSRRPYSVWLSGVYPRELDGLCKSLSFDMRVVDPAWAGAKLRQLLDYPEPRGDFLSWVPGARRQALYPSTVAYLVRLVIHRYAMLGILDEEGFPVEPMGLLEEEVEAGAAPPPAAGALEAAPGARCAECGSYAVVPRDGCEFCTACGAVGACG